MPDDWTYSMALLRHVIGLALISLQVWTIASIYESLGEFGWFFGDFFFPQEAPQLTYGGIYRFLNNPERTIGLAGVWGAAIMTWSKSIFFLALLSHVLTLCFIQFVEKPHMHKLYRQNIRQHSGVSKTMQRTLPSPVKKWQSSANRVLDETLDSLEDFLDQAGPKLASGFSSFVQDSQTLFSQFPARLTVTRLAPDLAGYDPKDYSVEIVRTDALKSDAPPSGREGENGQQPLKRTDSFERVVVEYGAPSGQHLSNTANVIGSGCIALETMRLEKSPSSVLKVAGQPPTPACTTTTRPTPVSSSLISASLRLIVRMALKRTSLLAK